MKLEWKFIELGRSTSGCEWIANGNDRVWRVRKEPVKGNFFIVDYQFNYLGAKWRRAITAPSFDTVEQAKEYVQKREDVELLNDE